MQEDEKDKKEVLQNVGVLPSHVSARDSKYHRGRNQFAATVDSLKGLNSLIGETFQKLKGQNHVNYMKQKLTDASKCIHYPVLQRTATM